MYKMNSYEVNDHLNWALINPLFKHRPNPLNINKKYVLHRNDSCQNHLFLLERNKIFIELYYFQIKQKKLVINKKERKYTIYSSNSIRLLKYSSFSSLLLFAALAKGLASFV